MRYRPSDLIPCLLIVFVAGPAVAADPIVLFNGKDLTNFTIFLKDTEKNTDPKQVFTVVEEDGAPAIRVSGEMYSGLITEGEYANYKLIVEFKWGDETFEPRKEKSRDSGILLHCVGEEGAANGLWMESIEYQLIEGGTGDFIVVAGKKTVGPELTTTVEDKASGPEGHPQAYYSPDGQPRTFTGGRVNWSDRDPNWVETLGFRGPNDLEKPVGEWNTVEIICLADTIVSKLNGKIVNKAKNVKPAKGRLLFQSEGAEVFFRKIVLVPLTK